jgi:hypothetical protein
MNTRFLKHLIDYVERQFGDRVLGEVYRESFNGERINNWELEIEMFLPLSGDLVNNYMVDKSLSRIDRDNLCLPCLEKMLKLVKSWSADFNLNCTSRTNNLFKDQMNYVLAASSQIERQIATIYTNRNEFNLAEMYC